MTEDEMPGSARDGDPSVLGYIAKWALISLVFGVVLGALKGAGLLASSWSLRLEALAWVQWLKGQFGPISGGLWLVAFLYGICVARLAGCAWREALWRVTAVAFGLFVFAGIALVRASCAQEHGFIPPPEVGRLWRWMPAVAATAIAYGLHARSWKGAALALLVSAGVLCAVFGAWIIGCEGRIAYSVAAVGAVALACAAYCWSGRDGIIAGVTGGIVVGAAWVAGLLAAQMYSGQSEYSTYAIPLFHGVGLVCLAGVIAGVARRSAASAALATAGTAVAWAMINSLGQISTWLRSASDGLRSYAASTSLPAPPLPGYLALTLQGPARGHAAWHDAFGGAALGIAGGLAWWATARERSVRNLAVTVGAAAVCGALIAALLRSAADVSAFYVFSRGGTPEIGEAIVFGGLAAGCVLITSVAFGLLIRIAHSGEAAPARQVRRAAVAVIGLIAACLATSYSYVSWANGPNHDRLLEILRDHREERRAYETGGEHRIQSGPAPLVTLDFSHAGDYRVPHRLDYPRGDVLLSTLSWYRRAGCGAADRPRLLHYIYREQTKQWRLAPALKTAQAAWRDYGVNASWARAGMIRMLMALRRWDEAARELEGIIEQGYVAEVRRRDKFGRLMTQTVTLYEMGYGGPEQMLATCYEMMGQWEQCLAMAGKALEKVKHPPAGMYTYTGNAAAALESQIGRARRARRDGVGKWSGVVVGSLRVGSARVRAEAILLSHENTGWTRWLEPWAPAASLAGFAGTSKGVFRFDGLPPGTYHLVVRFVYRPYMEGCAVLDGPKEISVDENTVHLDPIEFVPALRHKSPAAGATIRATNPVLSWYPHPRAAYYTVHISGGCEKWVWESGSITNSSVRVDAEGFDRGAGGTERWRGGLIPGAWYGWLVVAHDERGRAISNSQDYRLSGIPWFKVAK